MPGSAVTFHLAPRDCPEMCHCCNNLVECPLLGIHCESVAKQDTLLSQAGITVMTGVKEDGKCAGRDARNMS